jgi:hypothetical protein
MSTPDEAMKCCDTMACSSQGHEHSQDCCKTMPSMHAPFVQPASAHGVSFFAVFLAVLPGTSAAQSFDFSAQFFAAHSHAPPIPHAAASAPLRI